MTNDIDRKSIFITLIDSYLPQLTEEDLYKLHDLVRNTINSRKTISQSVSSAKLVLPKGETINESASPAIGDAKVLGESKKNRLLEIDRVAKHLIELEKHPITTRNKLLYGGDNLSDTDPMAKSLMENSHQFIVVAANEIRRLNLNTTPYGILIAAWSADIPEFVTDDPESGVDIFFGVRNIFDARIRLMPSHGDIEWYAENRRGGSTDSYIRVDALSEANLLSGLQILASRYQVAQKQPKS